MGALLMPLFAVDASAQALNVMIDASLASGLQRAGDVSQRSPTALDVDLGLVFDNDFTSEWGVGVTLQLEDTVALGLTPQARLVRNTAPWHFFLGAGVPVFVMPKTLYGLELGAGAVHDLLEGVGVVGQLGVDWFFAGENLPKAASTVIRLNASLGVRVLF